MSGCTKNRMLSAIIYPLQGNMMTKTGVNKNITIVLNELLVDGKGNFWLAMDRGIYCLSVSGSAFIPL